MGATNRPHSHARTSAAPVVFLAMGVVLIAMVFCVPAGGAVAGVVTMKGWAWPPSQDLWSTMLRLPAHAGDPKMAYPASMASRVPGPGVFWVAVVVLEALLMGVVIVLGIVIASRRHEYGMMPRSRARKAMKRNKSDLPPMVRYLGLPIRPRPNDAMLVIAPQQSGKTTGLAAPQLKDAPGAALGTGTKVDLIGLTIFTRHNPDDPNDDRRVAVFDPDRISGWPTLCRWNMVGGCEDSEIATERASALVAATPQTKGNGGNIAFFTGQARVVLQCLLHAAAISGQTMREVRRWAMNFADPEPLRILSSNPAACEGWHSDLEAVTQGAAGETVHSIQLTVAGTLASLSSPAVMDMICPISDRMDPVTGDRVLGDEGFDIDEFVTRNKDTLYLITLGGENVSTAPLVTAFVSSIINTGRRHSQRVGGKISPPQTFVLDEMANAAPVPEAPTLLSDGGGRGQRAQGYLQSFGQGRVRWGRDGFDAMWGSTSMKMLLPGCSETDDLEKVSRLIGDRRVADEFAMGGMSSQARYRQERTMPPDSIQQLDIGKGLMIWNNVGNAVVDVPGWWKRPDRKEFEESLKRYERVCGTSVGPVSQSRAFRVASKLQAARTRTRQKLGS